MDKTTDPLIRTIRGIKVILDQDLAAVYGTTTTRLNEQVLRNRARFPSDFMFRLTQLEWATANSAQGEMAVHFVDGGRVTYMRSQIATSNNRQRGGRRYRPYAFTEHGALMAANVLQPPPDPPKKEIGFHVRERSARYSSHRTRRTGP